MAPTFHTMYVVVNITVLIKTTESMMKNTSFPPGNSKVRPFFGIPRLLSSNMFVGASGSPGLRFPLSLSLRTSSTWLPSCSLGAFLGSGLRLRTRAALSFSLAVKRDDRSFKEITNEKG